MVMAVVCVQPATDSDGKWPVVQQPTQSRSVHGPNFTHNTKLTLENEMLSRQLRRSRPRLGPRWESIRVDVVQGKSGSRDSLFLVDEETTRDERTSIEAKLDE
ncbi:hypothetical protein HRR83_000157 [Exophiala dermatitidis]|uniref:Uncharacterized protein n=1 Tax=Exophiala dermatitidis TaxID=5970 RepID=A0AAN6IXZ5_EXODE|nr:hypothetical protein HRR73_002693 [Exophiala dermatitidis]KAJ4527405.1 hypothetical protein HRR74_000158 [Exophiala dermatitidis]KAJ4530968.1 hypothetical protein HRR76_008655 [Exophiala dermatitidis]KAJ4581832.1 hypothetical protein HRR79_000837 [Exophiala dermatitidis]KAJ4585028.1 hypothetical protein HRR81_000836 [Exophiala dermatitidis]